MVLHIPVGCPSAPALHTFEYPVLTPRPLFLRFHCVMSYRLQPGTWPWGHRANARTPRRIPPTRAATNPEPDTRVSRPSPEHEPNQPTAIANASTDSRSTATPNRSSRIAPAYHRGRPAYLWYAGLR
jgi:hypothetical protein